MSLTEARGLFAALGSIPTLVQPRDWLGSVLGPAGLVDLGEAEALLGLLMRAYNGVLGQLERRDPGICPPGDDWEETEAWCSGYDAGLRFADDEDLDLLEAQRPLDVIDALRGDLPPREVDEGVDDEEAWHEEESRKLSSYVFELHALWERARRPDAPPSAPKVGRNDPCPCGSGKKHKKCCMN